MKKGGKALKEMDYFESYSDERLIKDWVSECEPPAFDARWYPTADVPLAIRESIYIRKLEDRQDVKEADIFLIECVLKDGADPPDADDPEKYPPFHWWWHLDKIADKTYPADLLPEHLKEIYTR
jgi:hypothetical protein